MPGAIANMPHRAAETMKQIEAGIERVRLRLYFRWLVEQGAKDRWGPFWEDEGDSSLVPEWQWASVRRARLEMECEVIQKAGFEGAFVMLADMLDFCRREGIPYGPGRGSVGGSLACYCLGIHDVDSLEWDLLFERFMNPDRVSFPDVDIDLSQRHRQRVVDYVVDKYTTDGQVVLRIGAFARAGGRAIVDAMLAAMAPVDEHAGATAAMLKKCFPDKGNITGGLKVQRELAWWLEHGHGKRDEFRQIAEQAGWLPAMLKLDGMFTHLGKHAAGVVILRRQDLPFIPQTSSWNDKTKRRDMATAYDMYSLDDLGYPKWDLLGLRTLDVVVDAHKLMGGSGNMRELLRLWQERRGDDEPYEILREGKMTGIFQMDTPGFAKCVKDMQPTAFEHVVQLVALYRPGAIDYQFEDGRNMVQVFIDRHHGREPVTFAHPLLRPILGETNGIILYQEQAMKIVRDLGGFTRGQADSLRKAIGKKRPKDIAKLKPLWDAGAAEKGIQEAVREGIWQNIEAAGRYSWNKSHAVAYAIITWWSCWFMSGTRRHAGFAAEINSLAKDRDKQANTVSEARQDCTFRPPDINVADAGFGIEDGEIVFGLSGIKGLGGEGRGAILIERLFSGPFAGYEDFCRRVPGLGTDKKASLVACGAFDRLGESRVRLLAEIPKGDPAWTWWFECGHTMRKMKDAGLAAYGFTDGTASSLTSRCSTCKADRPIVRCEPIERKSQRVLDHVNDCAKNGKAKPLPPLDEWVMPTDSDLAKGEMDAMGYYITNVPLAEVTKDLGRMPASYVGGEVHSVRAKPDKNNNVMGHIQITTPALTRARVLVFASSWPQMEHKVVKGAQLIFRGRQDGDTYLAEACWDPGDYRHFKKMKVWRPGSEKPDVEPLDPTTGREQRAALIKGYEQQGCRVRLL
jgi:DNA-directed DNA polymerase III PolC